MDNGKLIEYVRQLENNKKTKDRVEYTNTRDNNKYTNTRDNNK